MKEHRLIDARLSKYCEECSSPEPAISEQIAHATMGHPNAHMVVGKIVGNLLRILVVLGRAKRVLEIGTFTGYSASMMASALPGNGTVISFEEVAANYELAVRNLRKQPNQERIKVILEEAFSWLRSYSGPPFDLIFLDGRKQTYVGQEDLLHFNLRIGGILVVDNSLARGKVLNPKEDWVSITDQFNHYFANDNHFISVLLPVRDGILLACRIS